MARARNIKPGFFKNYELADLGPIAQVLFAGLWCLADKEGRMEDKPRLIKAEIFPYYECDINGELTKLERLGFVERYTECGIAVISVCNFKKHQTPHNTEKASTLPARSSENQHQSTVSEDNGGFTVDSRKSNGGKTPDSLIPDSLIPSSLIPDSLSKPAAPVGADCDPAFDQAWAEYPKRPGASKAGAWKAWRARIKAKADPDEIIAGVRRYARYVEATGTEPQFVKQPATFFGPDEHWKSDWTAQPRASPYQSKTDKAKQWTDQITGRTSNDQPEFIDIN